MLPSPASSGSPGNWICLLGLEMSLTSAATSEMCVMDMYILRMCCYGIARDVAALIDL